MKTEESSACEKNFFEDMQCLHMRPQDRYVKFTVDIYGLLRMDPNVLGDLLITSAVSPSWQNPHVSTGNNKILFGGNGQHVDEVQVKCVGVCFSVLGVCLCVRVCVNQ